jgi:hypothetical protein
MSARGEPVQEEEADIGAVRQQHVAVLQPRAQRVRPPRCRARSCPAIPQESTGRSDAVWYTLFLLASWLRGYAPWLFFS